MEDVSSEGGSDREEEEHSSHKNTATTPPATNPDNDDNNNSVNNDLSLTQEEETDMIGGHGDSSTLENTLDTVGESHDGGANEESEKELTTTKPSKGFEDFSGHVLGGKCDTPAFCLLDGFVQDSTAGGAVRPFRVPINRLPAILGRTHETSESNFFGLGTQERAMSRNQFRIDYRVPSGTLGQFKSSDEEFSYRPTGSEIVHNPQDENLCEKGIYVVTCLGKNAVWVNGRKCEQNETYYLPHGSTVRFQSYALYFLLPSKPSTVLMDVPIKNIKKNGKRKRKPGTDSTADNSPAAPSKKAKGSTTASSKSKQEDLEQMTTEELLSEMQEAHEKGVYDRRLGPAIMLRAICDAARSPELQTIQKNAPAQAPGVAKRDILQWLEESEKYSSWVEIMQSKLEPKSYQVNISRAMERAGYERSTTVSMGRHVRWYLPADLCPRPSYDGENPQEESGGNEEDADSDAEE
jgi:pSer/pThr/pTyr-binding forkhead associated (FHA) protein